MQLYLLRHGIAEDIASDGAGDAGRALTREGIERMQAEARGMQRLGIELDVLLSSPLKRARQTAEIAGHALGCGVQIEPALASGMHPKALLMVLERYAARRVMVVGHEPDLSMAISTIIGGGHVSMKKGSLALLELPYDAELDGILLWLASPKLLRSIG
jgi:phosphohistidine phosphatase